VAETSDSIIIDAHPAQVWPYLFGSKEKLLQWQHKSGKYSSIRDADINIADDPNGDKVGSITAQTTDGRQMVMSLVEYNEPRYVTFTCQYLVNPIAIDQFLMFELEPAEDPDGKEGIKTQLTVSVEWYMAGSNLPLRLLAGIGSTGKFKEMIFFTLRNIKALVEKNTVTSNEEAVYADIDD
jgi:hypothetical protein